MQGYLIYIFIVILFGVIGEITRQKGFEKLVIRRECDKYLVNPGEEFKMTTTLENKKWLPVSFLYVEEELPSEIQRGGNERCEIRGSYNSYINSYSILWFERIKRTYTGRIENRGVYLMRNMQVSVGDIFGFSYETKPMEDVQEIVVYPRLKPLKALMLQNNSIQGESIVKRWIYKDPLYIKGIREYNIEDRMKDIHWKSSLRMNKLMVKDYDYTSERELMIIVDVQAGEPYWTFGDMNTTERSVEAAAAFAYQAVNDGVPTGLWTNAQILNYSGTVKKEIFPSTGSFKSIMELCARIDRTCRVDFSDYLNMKAKDFNKNTIYVIITAYLSERSMAIIQRLRRMGFIMKVVDTTAEGTLPYLDGIEKIVCGGGAGDESL